MAKVTDGKHISLKNRLREMVLVPRMTRQWRKRASALNGSLDGAGTPQSLLILSSHTADPLASKGDEAMLVAVATKLRKANPALKIAIAVESDKPNPALAAIDVTPVAIWTYPWDLDSVFDAALQYDACFCIGADVMDGYYSSIKSLRLWMIADLMARAGKPSTVGGFSWNTHPTRYVLNFIKSSLSKQLRVCLRDAVSHQRFKQQSDHPGTVVADNAFMLEPMVGAGALPAVDWADAQRVAGRPVIAFNIHPMLIPDRDPAKVAKLVDASVAAVKTLIASEGASVLLIPHDFRGQDVGDLYVLNQIVTRLAEYQAYIFCQTQDIPAAEIKAIASQAELVVTGRMHLSIGALGTGTPILGITYQGKFEGLIQHFALPGTILISPEEMMDIDNFVAFCQRGFQQRAELTEMVAAKLADVKELAALNLQGFY